MSSSSGSNRLALILLNGQALFLGLAVSVFFTASNTMFLMDFSSDLLPYVYVATAVFVSLISYLFVRMQKTWSIGRFTGATVLSFACLIFAARLGIQLFNTRWISFGLMVVFTLFMQLSLVVLGAQAGQIFDVREMKRLYPIVMAGQIFGVIAGGALVGPLAVLMGGIKNLLILAGGSMATAWVFLAVTNRRFGRILGVRPSGNRRSPQTSLLLLLRKPYVLMIFVFQIFVYVGSNLINYLFIDRIDARFQDALAMTRFLGNFMAISTLLTLLFLVLLSGRLLMSYGVGMGLAGYSLAVGLVMGLSILVGMGWSSSLPFFFRLILTARLLNFVITTGMTDPAIKAMYQPLPSQDRTTVQTIVEGIGVPVAVGIAGLLLLLFKIFRTISINHITLFTFLLLGFLAYLSLRLYRKYEEALAGSLGRRVLNPVDISLSDKSSLKVVENLLLSKNLAEVQLALDMLEEGNIPLSKYLLPMISHSDSDIRKDVFTRIERLQLADLLPCVADQTEKEQDSGTKAAALRAICAIDPGEVDSVVPYLSVVDPEVQMGAMVGLLRFGGTYGGYHAGRRLHEWIESNDPNQQLAVARLLGEVGSEGFYQPLVPLLSHSRLDIRRQALLSSGLIGNPKLLPAVALALQDHATRAAAISALMKFGDKYLPLLEDALQGQNGYGRETNLRIVRISGQIRSAGLIPVLRDNIRHPDSNVRYELLRSLSLCGYRAHPDEYGNIKGSIREEVNRGAFLLKAMDFFNESQTPWLNSSFRAEWILVQRRIFLLLSFLFEQKNILGAEEKLVSGIEEEHSLALELLDVTLSRDLRPVILGLLDTRSPLDKRLQKIEKVMDLPESVKNWDSKTALVEIISGRIDWLNVWTRAYAIYHAGQQEDRNLLQIIETLPDTEPPLIRETSLWSLNKAKGDSAMLAVEKVIALKSIEIFANTSDFSLGSLASILEEIHVSGGETFIHKGDIENCMYLIVQGKVRVHDDQKEIARLGEGEIIGEMSLLDPAPRSATITALEDTQLFKIEKEAFDVVMADNPEIVQGVIRVLCRRLRTRIEPND